MRAPLFLFVLMIWMSFVLGSITMLAYLGYTLLDAVRRSPTTDSGATRRPLTWRLPETLIAAGGIVAATYGAAMWVGFSALDGKFLFAGGPAVLCAALAGVTTLVVHRRQRVGSVIPQQAHPMGP